MRNRNQIMKNNDAMSDGTRRQPGWLGTVLQRPTENDPQSAPKKGSQRSSLWDNVLICIKSGPDKEVLKSVAAIRLPPPITVTKLVDEVHKLPAYSSANFSDVTFTFVDGMESPLPLHQEEDFDNLVQWLKNDAQQSWMRIDLVMCLNHAGCRCES